MKTLKLSALLLGAVLFVGMGATALAEEGMKCGAGKCGKSMEKPAGKCGKDKNTSSKCGKGKCG